MSVLLVTTTVMSLLPLALMLLEAVIALNVPVSLATLGMESLVQVCTHNECRMGAVKFT